MATKKNSKNAKVYHCQICKGKGYTVELLDAPGTIPSKIAVVCTACYGKKYEVEV